MNTRWRRLASPILFCALAARLWAGGSGLNVVVVVNQSSSNSVQLGNYYCEKRQVPPQNLLRVSWAGGNVEWPTTDFQSVLLNPLLSMLSARQLTNQIDYVLLCMDLPYRVADVGSYNSTTSDLFYGFKTNAPPPAGLPASCSLPSASFNAYAGSEYPFRSVGPGTSNTNFLTVMLTASNLAQAKLVIDRGLASDSTFPTQTVYLGKSDDTVRNVRYVLFDNAIFNARLRGSYSMQRTNANWSNGLGYIGGYENGYPGMVPTTNYAPGALADQLTSWGGSLFEVTGQTTALDYLDAGAAGSYGTVTEPCAYLQKFPSPQCFYYQSRGFSMAESYYQSITNPYQGLLVGEPLAAPFARTLMGSWNNLPLNALLSGTTNLSLQANAVNTLHPVQRVDLFVDGRYATTLTNIPPGQNNSLNVTINGRPTNYLVPAGATIPSVTAGLAAVLNKTTYTNLTKVSAFTHGDRIELQSFDITQPGAQIGTSASSSGATALTTFVTASQTNFFDTVACGIRSWIPYNAPGLSSYLLLTVTTTNGTVVTVQATNSPGNTSITALTQTLVDLINATPALQGTDGLTAEDLLNHDGSPTPFAQFHLRARSGGWSAAQIQANLTCSSDLGVQYAGTFRLDENLPDLQPRNHLYVTAGVTNLALSFGFNTTTQADGYHELTAVLYEGSHVRTQKRIAQTMRIQNSPLAAAFTTLVGDTNTALEATFQFSVVANTNNISRIELFSTGGSLTNVLNQSNVVFSVAGTNLGLGLHPFYAIVTANGGRQYRTETKWIRLVGADAPFPVSLAASPAKLTWPAAAGRSYDILTTTNLTHAPQPSATVIPTNSAAQWTDTNLSTARRFYRVRMSN
jgi:uncharacterized protein (TIGR03790 family)